MSNQWRRGYSWLAILTGMALAIALYAAALRFEFQGYDDQFFVRDSPQLQGGLTWASVQWALTANLLGVERAAEYWMPLTLLSRLLDMQLFGPDGGWHHLQNILLHGLNASLLFLVLREAAGAPGRSAFVAGLFLVHPLTMEVVGWVALRKDVLAATFCLLALWGHVRFGRTRSRSSYLFSLLAFAGALASKPSSMSFPLALMLFDIWPLRRLGRPLAWRALATCVAEKVPFALLAVAGAGLTYVGQSDAGTAHATLTYTFGDRVTATLIGFGEYLQRALLPDQLCVLYPLAKPETLSLAQAIWIASVLLMLSFLWLMLALRGRWAGLVGWLWFVGLMLPVSGLVQFGRQATADRYMYLPLIGLLIALVWLTHDLWARAVRHRLGGARAQRWAALGAASLVCLTLAVKARRQLAYWENGLVLWEQAASVVPDHVYALRMIGRELILRGQPRAGLAMLFATVKMAPEMVEVQATYGVELARQGRHAEALPYLERALKLAPLQLELHRSLVSCLRTLGREEDGRKAWVRLQLVRVDAFVRKALEFAVAGESALARGQFDLAWSAAAEARREARGARLFRPGTKFWSEIEEKLKDLARGRGSESDLPYMQLCVRYIQSGPQGLEAGWSDFTRRYPGEADGWWRLAICLFESDRLEEAKAAAAEAARRDASNSEPVEEWARLQKAPPQREPATGKPPSP